MYQEYRVTYYNDNDWKLPLNLAIGFHLIIAFGSIYLPDFFHSKPPYQDIYTVDLINFTEPVIEEPSAASTPPPQVTKPVPDSMPTKKAVSIVQKVPPPEAPPAKAISIRPLKRKIKKKIVINTSKANENKRRKELEKLRRKRLAEALRAEQIATEKAKDAAEEAVNELKQMLRTTSSMDSGAQKQSSRTSTARNSSAQSSAVETRYHGAINNRIQQFWALPEYKVWAPSLQAIVVVTINKDGTIANQFFEKRSGDRIFDQFVQKTIQDATPLPPIPPALKHERIEIGLRFTPSGIQ